MPLIKFAPKGASRLPKYTYLGCPLANGQPWCYRLCRPTAGKGVCGRPAPHLERGAVQRAIDAHKSKQSSAG